MKKTLTILFIAYGSIVNAQTHLPQVFSTEKGNKPDNFHAHVMQLLKNQQAATAQKPTAIKERVIAQSVSDSNMFLEDSTVIKYSGTNGSRFDYNFMSYSYGYSSFGFTPNYYPYDFQEADVQLDALCNWSDDGNGLDTSVLLYGQYTATGMLSKMEEIDYNMGTFDYASIYANTYNAQGGLAQLIYLEDNGSGYDSVGKLTRTYDNNNRKTVDTLFDYSSGLWDISGIFRFTYGATGLLDSFYIISSDGAGGWNTDAIYVHTHDNSGRVETVTGYSDLGSGMIAVVTDTFQYTGSNTYFTNLIEYQYNGSGLEPLLMISKNLGANNLPDTMWYSQYDFAMNTWVPMMQSAISYNSQDNPVQQEVAVDMSGSGFDVMQIIRYYYEQYDDQPQSASALLKNADITLYPNPAASTLNMTWNNADGKRTTVELINTAGQKLYAQSFPWKEKNQTLSLENLTPGMYWVVIRNAAGAVLFRQPVVKQ